MRRIDLEKKPGIILAYGVLLAFLPIVIDILAEVEAVCFSLAFVGVLACISVAAIIAFVALVAWPETNTMEAEDEKEEELPNPAVSAEENANALLQEKPIA